MGRLQNISKAGFYPFLESHFPLVVSQFVPPKGESWMLDPCAGEGVFARYLADHLHMKLATVEINYNNSEKCRRVSDHHVSGDAMQVEYGHEQIAFQWLNPPFMEDAEDRMEWKFLQKYRNILAPGGVLAYTIPGATMLKDSHILPHLVRFYKDHKLYWLPEPNPYKQILYIGIRRSSKSEDGEEKDRLVEILQNGKPILEHDDCIQIPTVSREYISLRGREIDWNIIIKEAAHEGLDFEFPETFSEKAETVLPLKKGHLVSVLAGGGLDNARLGDDIIRGSVRQEQTEVESNEEGVTIEQTTYHSQIVAFNPKTGEYRIFEQGSGLSDYMMEHATQLTQQVKARFVPRYEFDMGVIPEETRRIIHTLGTSREPVPGKPRGLWPGQRHVLAGLERSWASGIPCLMAVCKMGWGKSLLAAGAIAVNHEAVGYKPSIFVTEPHLVEQMVTEVRITWPLAKVVRVDTIDDARLFFKSYEQASEEMKRKIPFVAVIGKQRLKNGTGWVPAVVKTKKRVRSGSIATAYRCPSCGQLQVYPHGKNRGYTILNDDGFFSSNPASCCYSAEEGSPPKGCGAPLWQFSREIGGTDGIGQDGDFKGGVVTYSGKECTGTYQYITGYKEYKEATGYKPLNIHPPEPVVTPWRSIPGKVRWPLVKWLTKVQGDNIGTVIVDEVHGYKAQNTDAGYALGELIRVGKRVLLMTGTLFGGCASSIFFLAHRASPKFRTMFKYNELQRFVEQYGVLEKKTVEKEYGYVDRGRTTAQTRKQTFVKELPGVSPSLITLFLEFTLFSDLTDLGIKLPDVERRILPVKLDETHHGCYSSYKDRCLSAMREASKKVDENDEPIRLSGSLLHTLRGYAIAPWREEQLTDKYGEIWASAPNLEMVCPKCKEVSCSCGEEPVRVPRLFAAEKALLEEIGSQVGRGRKTVVFVDQTRTRDIVTTRLIPLVHNAGFRALFCDVEANKRAAWIEKNSHKCDVMFVNPKAVETGLNLVMFQTAIFYEIPYSLYVFKQAAARPRRPTQTQKVEIIYINPVDTIAEQALSLMFEKLAAEAVFSGDNAESILNNELSSGSFMSELIKRVTDNAQVDNLEQMFTRYNKLEAENDGYFKDYDLSSYESVETISQQKTIILEGPLEGVQLSLFGI